MEYTPVLVPNLKKNSKPSKRFQICNDAEDIGRNENANVFNCTNVGTNRQIHLHGNTPAGNSINEFENEMEYGALLADHLGIWVMGIDFEYAPNCPNILKSENCELKVC
jgi:hypothetical protein